MKGLLHNLLVTLLAICLCVAVGEIAARALLPPHPIYRVPQPVHDPHPSIGWVLRPSQDAYTQSEPLRINSAGLRDDDDAPAKPSGEQRVLVLGDSVTFGNGVATRDTYPAVLEALLRERGIQARVLNAGVQGYDIHQEVLFLSDRGWALEPDVLVVGLYENDIVLRSQSYSGRVDGDGDFAAGGLRALVPTEIVYFVKRLRVVVYVGQLMRELRWRFFPPEANYHIQALFFDRPSPNSERAWEQVAESLEAIQSEAEARGLEVVLAIFPHHGQMLEGALVHTYQGRVHEIAERLGLETIDLLEPYRESVRDGTSPFIPYDGHPDENGHRIAGSALVEPVAAALARTREAGEARAEPSS